MGFEIATTAAASGQDGLFAKFARWTIGKVWFGGVLTGVYYAGNRYGWPQFFLTVIAVVGAAALALVTVYLPAWTRTWTTGARPLDLGIKWAVWLGLAVPVVGLLVGSPATGACALALLLVSLARTFHDRLEPIRQMLRMEDRARPAPPQYSPVSHPAARAHPAPAARPHPARRVPVSVSTGAPPRAAPTLRRRSGPLVRPGGWGPR